MIDVLCFFLFFSDRIRLFGEFLFCFFLFNGWMIPCMHSSGGRKGKIGLKNVVYVDKEDTHWWMYLFRHQPLPFKKKKKTEIIVDYFEIPFKCLTC